MSMRYMGLITERDCHHQWPCDNAELITHSHDAKTSMITLPPAVNVYANTHTHRQTDGRTDRHKQTHNMHSRNTLKPKQS
jgi:hypothetical protein